MTSGTGAALTALRAECRAWKRDYDSLAEKLKTAEAALADLTRQRAALVQQWREEQATYPPTSEGMHAAAAVRCCANELEQLASPPIPPEPQEPT